jgi:hypothetical protein
MSIKRAKQKSQGSGRGSNEDEKPAPPGAEGATSGPRVPGAPKMPSR